ncbi:MAG: helicase-exonuclease AddAB subunit AddA [Lachnospiraceae bacterium]|nr:helicase-exonuclease AddAB subunit AddA [Lachnospiraceae bacterium]
MSVTWTEEQRQVIEARNGDLLVSAGAGSGKTAVLVERILSRITDPEHPMDIDRLLVVTYTNAAAAEMRNRIEAALERRAEAEPENGHIRRQTVLIHHAKILTIHSFCLYVIRNYFSRISLDPNFRVAEEGELKLMRGDVCAELFEEAYASGNEAFLRFSESYSLGKTAGGLEDYLLDLYHFTMSYPFPEETLNAWEAELADGAAGAWLKELTEDVRKKAEELETQCDSCLALCREADGPFIYEPMILSDLEQIRRLKEAPDYEAICKNLANLTFPAMSKKRPKEIDEEKKAAVSALRGHVKKTLQKLAELYGTRTPEELEAENEACREPLQVLIALTRAFKERYEAAKRERNVADFGDLEHLALAILIEKREGGYEPSDAAKELGESFEEILIDEYQDSNLLQETILTAVSGEWEGRRHMFRVGDVKQSIYRFRLARPELFMEKYHAYSTEEGSCRRIDLHRNFRSRPEVLDSVNRVFYRIMGKTLGGIAYGEEEALIAGRPSAAGDFDTEFWLIAPEEKELLTDVSKKEMEARVIADRIREMTRPGNRLLKTEANPEGEDLCYRDIAVLLRTYAGWAEVFAEVLSDRGIPVFVQSKTGYFDTREVSTALNLLRIIDNPRQDIPLAAVLKSPVGKVNNRELAVMTAEYRRAGEPATEAELYEAFVWYREKGEEEALREKLARLGKLLQGLRERSRVKTVYEILNLALEESGYELFAAAMPGGEARRANLAMLKQKALDYESTSYHSLFDFIRYIENLRKYEVDYGEAARIGENENAVRIFSIHKSKGLEFPVCIVAGLAKSFNHTDSRKRILIHADLGLAADVIDPFLRTKRPSLRKTVLAGRMIQDDLGEELRVLYVAMTRAREKLILTAAVEDAEKTEEKWKALKELPCERVPYTYRLRAGSYLDWLMMARMGDEACFKLDRIALGDILFQEIGKQGREEGKRRDLEADGPFALSGEEKKQLDKQLSFQYPYERAIYRHRKISVSDLKRASMEEEDARTLFSGGGGRESGADRGNAYHRLLSCLTFSKCATEADVEREKSRLEKAGKMRPEELALVRSDEIALFLASDLGKRMARAEAEGRLRREQRFVMGIPDPSLETGGEMLLIQGVMDACFWEREQGILVDYKTDRVPEAGGREILRKRYEVQLDSYRKALEQMTRSPVTECWIYSFALGEAIRMEKG